MKLPSSTREQQALIGVLVSDACCHSPDALIECERLGVNESHFVDPERTLWLEIVKAERELRPFDLVSLCGHLERTRNGDGTTLSTHLTECATTNGAGSLRGAIALLQDYAKTLIETKAVREAHLLGKELTDAANKGGGAYLEVIERITSIGRSEAGKGLPRIVSASDLCAKPPPTPPELIHGVLHQGSKLALGGGSKSFKTWTLLELAVCVSTGRQWLGFPTTQGRVLYLNFELPEFSMEQRIREICAAMGVEVPRNLSLWNLRGYAADATTILPRISRQAQRDNYSLLILDPLYKLLGARDENASRDMADLMNGIERVAVETGAAVAFGSHYSKGNQAGKESMDRISGSGVFARDPDAIITMTRHEQDDAFAVEMTLRNHPPQEPFVVRREHPLMVIDGQLDPAKLRQAGGRKEEVSADDVLATLGDDALTYGEWLKRAEEQLFTSADTFKRRLRKLKAAGRIRQSHSEGGKYVRA